MKRGFAGVILIWYLFKIPVFDTTSYPSFFCKRSFLQKSCYFLTFTIPLKKRLSTRHFCGFSCPSKLFWPTNIPFILVHYPFLSSANKCYSTNYWEWRKTRRVRQRLFLFVLLLKFNAFLGPKTLSAIASRLRSNVYGGEIPHFWTNTNVLLSERNDWAELWLKVRRPHLIFKNF